MLCTYFLYFLFYILIKRLKNTYGWSLKLLKRQSYWWPTTFAPVLYIAYYVSKVTM